MDEEHQDTHAFISDDAQGITYIVFFDSQTRKLIKGVSGLKGMNVDTEEAEERNKKIQELEEELDKIMDENDRIRAEAEAEGREVEEGELLYEDDEELEQLYQAKEMYENPTMMTTTV